MSTILNLARLAFLLASTILTVACASTVVPEVTPQPQATPPSGTMASESEPIGTPPASSTPDIYPPVPSPTYTLPPYPWLTLTPRPTPTLWTTWTPWPTPPPKPTAIPSETPEPSPTLSPTPTATLIPTITPPFIPIPEGTVMKPFSLYFRDGEVIRSLSTEVDAEPQVFLDPLAEFSLYLPPEEAYIWTWGTFSPDGRSVALVLTDVPEPVDYSRTSHPVSLYILDLETRALRHLVDNGFNPVWSPDSKRLAYSSGELWVADVKTGETFKIYTAEPVNDFSAFADNYVWAPDNRYLVLTKESSFVSYDLVVVDADRIDPPETLIPGPLYWVTNPQWSPEGTQISYIMPGQERMVRYNLWVMAPDGTHRRQLTSDLSALNALWSPDGKWIAFAGLVIHEAENPAWNLWLVDPISGALERLTYSPPLSPGESVLSWAPDGTRLVFIRHKPESIHEVRILSLVDGSEQFLIDSLLVRDAGVVLGP